MHRSVVLNSLTGLAVYGEPFSEILLRQSGVTVQGLSKGLYASLEMEHFSLGGAKKSNRRRPCIALYFDSKSQLESYCLVLGCSI